MRIRSVSGFAAAIVTAVLSPMTAGAADDVPQVKGFSGYVLFGGGYLRTEDNLLAGSDLIDLGMPIINSVDSAPQDSKNSAIPIISGEVVYTISPGRTALFLGSAASGVAGANPGPAFGVRHVIDDIGRLELSGSLPGIDQDIWADPYAAGVEREKTGLSTYGVRLRWDRMFGSMFEVDIGYGILDVDDERSGEFLGLDDTNRALLNRNGDNVSVALNYRWKASQSFVLQPQLAYLRAERDGEAERHDALSIGMSATLIGNPVTFVASVSYTALSFNADHPVYARRADSERFQIGVTAIYKLQTESRRWSLLGSLSYRDTASQVEFFDNNLALTMVGFRYRFGMSR